MKRKRRLVFYRDHKQEWRWQMRAGNGRIVGDSAEGYTRLADCEQITHWMRDHVVVVVER